MSITALSTAVAGLEKLRETSQASSSRTAAHRTWQCFQQEGTFGEYLPGFGVQEETVMRSHPETSIPSQRGTIQHLLPQVDAEWEVLTRDLQAVLQTLASLQICRQHLFFLLRAEPSLSPCGTQARFWHLAAVEQQIRQVSQEISHIEGLRRTLECWFDEARRSLNCLRQQTDIPTRISCLRGVWLRYLLTKRPLRALWGRGPAAETEGPLIPKKLAWKSAR